MGEGLSVSSEVAALFQDQDFGHPSLNRPYSADIKPYNGTNLIKLVSARLCSSLDSESSSSAGSPVHTSHQG